MFTLPNYQIFDTIYESANSIIYRGLREDNQPIILKMLKTNYPTVDELARYQQEYNILHELTQFNDVIKVYNLEKYQNILILSLEDFGGQSLKQWLTERSFSVEESLQLAIQAANILVQIHQNNIIHKDINPSNFIWNATTRQLKLIDFGISSRLRRENPILKNPNQLEGTLAYISPEQTGRMNQTLDYRTDLYSLGVTCYELFTGQLPFCTKDPLELVHSHIAKKPSRLNEVNPKIPSIVSDIVMKLMAKDVKARYQSALGLKWDLEKCLEHFKSPLNLDSLNFELGQSDFSGQLQISSQLYGREHEINTLLQAFEQVSSGSTKLILVAGYSGVGKTTLVQQVHQPMTAKHGYFAAGKFDQYQRNIPYYALTQAFNEFCHYLLAENPEQLNQWREEILTAISNNGQILIDIIPHLELIIGPQPAVPSVGATEAQNRFNWVLQQFIEVIAQKEHPFILFIDDLQWADLPSLDLLKRLITNLNIQYLLIIGAYRDNEVSTTHPLVMMIKDLTASQAPIETIHLDNLALNDVNKLLADSLRCDLARTQALTFLIYRKTQGNAFFTREFLKSLYTQALLVFDRQTQQWQWEYEQIAAQEMTDNVLVLMVNKIEQLPYKSQEILKLAACIGNQFDLKTVAVISQQALKDTLALLFLALEKGLLVPLDNNYKLLDFSSAEIQTTTAYFKFQHDRIQQAAYSLIPPEQKQAIHLQIGRLLLIHTTENLSEHIFDLVNQFNKCLPLINEENEKLKLAHLNLIAGQKAKVATAYESALEYLKISLELLANDSWQKHYQLSLQIYSEATEIAYLNTDFAQMEEWGQVVLQQAQTLLEKIPIYELQIQVHMAYSNPQEALNIALFVLKHLKINFPENPSQLDFQQALTELTVKLAEKPIDVFRNMPIMTAPDKLAIVRLLSTVMTACFALGMMNLYGLIAAKIVYLSITHGNTKESTIGCVGCGVTLCAVVGNIEMGFQFGELATQLVEQLNAKEFKAKVSDLFNFTIKHSKTHVKNTLEPLLEGYQIGLETGDILYSGYNVAAYCIHSYFLGNELTAVKQEIKFYNHILAQMKQELTLMLNEPLYQLISNLLENQGNDSFLYHLIHQSPSQPSQLIRLLPQRENDNASTLVLLYIYQLILCYLFQAYLQAIENASLAKKYLFGMPGSLITPVCYFYDSLTQLALYFDSSVTEQKNILDNVNYNQEKMEKYAKHAPMNYLHKFHLVEAERCRVLNHNGEAREHYDQAIELARENEYVNEEALACELAGRFYLARENSKIAQVYLNDARYAYQRWGAVAKVQDLDNRYPQLLVPAAAKVPGIGTITTAEPKTVLADSAFLDLKSVMKASQTLSREMRLNHLLEKMTQIIIENAGAEQGCLLSEQAGNWIIKASEVDNKVIQVATTIVNYVARTQEAIVLNNATKEGQFTKDPYIVSYQPKSILCVPLINQGKLVGIVYLENNLAMGAFTPERVETVQLLGAQAAISLENARLYENLAEYNRTLETKVEERTQELSQALEDLRATQQELIQSEKMAALGQLIAGIAHEINTPLGAIRASINNITQALSDSIHQLPQLLRELSTEQQDLFFAFTQQAFQPKSPLTSREERQIRRKLINELEEKGLEDVDEVADTLVDIGLYQDIDAFIPLLTAINSELILQVAYDLATQQTNSQNIETAVEKASKIIFALKSYARYDHTGQAVKTNLVESLNVVLTLYHNQLKHGIELITNYQEIPEIMCYPDELNQVWTNLIHNAIQAMNNQGQLDIVVFSQAEQIIVQITDSGVGIPAEIKDRIFEPFFTTKGAGEGSGLGLDIVRKIINKHHGNIVVESQPGKTTFSIFLPIITA
jgi:predicted ATPase/signal transduction histidine kinase/tRNA A-37 threonylcarbamoyl transferase component Bud32